MKEMKVFQVMYFAKGYNRYKNTLILQIYELDL